MIDVTPLLNPLNETQRQAVTAPPGALLVLAGAGSGKTRVLVHRIAWQIQVLGVSPQSILAVTFTNKAAREMRGRIETLLERPTHNLWIGTFHGLAHRLLRRHARQANLPDAFQVMDSADQLRVIKRILQGMNLDEARWPPKQVQWFINAQKDEGVRARHLPESGDLYLRQMQVIYRSYEELCDRSGLVDFAELLLRTHEILRDNPDLLAFYQQRFQEVHVDEFQDTNTIQYAWLRLLTQDRNNLFVVGDDDQSIYGWRGARIENIHHFRKQFPDHKLIKLEQNYRSTGNILKAANQVIAHNESRLGKELWTDAGEGEPISVYAAFNEQDEAFFVVERIRAAVSAGGMRADHAVLYRSNAQSRQFEERLVQAGMPYRVYGGLRFFDRAEIKNALAYLRLVANRDDDVSFERVVNTPTRGIGAKTVDDLRVLARERGSSLWAAAAFLLEQRQLSARAGNALAGFLQLIDRLENEAEGTELFDQVKRVIEKSGLIDFYQQSKGDQGEEKVENLEELVNAARLFDSDAGNEENLGPLELFLSHAALEAGEMQGEDAEDCVQLMTFHAAKGLEFDSVFMVGMEEGLFPSLQSIEEPHRLEEERRLCYVGLTRARRLLYATYAESRRLYGRDNYPRPSRFLREIPAECIREVRLRAQISRPLAPQPGKTAIPGVSPSRFKLGQRVSHVKFGEGIVLQLEGQGEQERAQINFKDVGIKWLMVAIAGLNTLS